MEPIVIVEGKGAVVKDIKGKEYLDFFSGIAVTNLGHCHPKIIKAIQDQTSKLFHCSSRYYTLPVVSLAEKIASITPTGLNKFFFCSSGAEAIEGSIKLAKKYAYKKGGLGTELVALEGSFHGRTALTLSLTGMKKHKVKLGTYANYPGVIHAPAPYCYRCALNYPDCDINCAKILERIFDLHSTGDVAALIVEPVMGEGGIIVPPDEYLPEVQRICNKLDILLIADEVQSGFGRCGKFFASDIWGVQPDIITMAKGIGSGIPLGAFVASEKVAEAFEPGDHFSTYSGNPIICSAALANVEALIEDKVPQNADRIGKYMLEELKGLFEKYESIGEIRGKGLMIGIELVSNQSKKTPDSKKAAKIKEECMKRGVLIGTGGIYNNVLRLQPPLIIKEEQTHHVLNILDISFKTVDHG